MMELAKLVGGRPRYSRRTGGPSLVLFQSHPIRFVTSANSIVLYSLCCLLEEILAACYMKMSSATMFIWQL